MATMITTNMVIMAVTVMIIMTNMDTMISISIITMTGISQNMKVIIIHKWNFVLNVACRSVPIINFVQIVVLNVKPTLSVKVVMQKLDPEMRFAPNADVRCNVTGRFQ